MVECHPDLEMLVLISELQDEYLKHSAHGLHLFCKYYTLIYIVLTLNICIVSVLKAGSSFENIGPEEIIFQIFNFRW